MNANKLSWNKNALCESWYINVRFKSIQSSRKIWFDNSYIKKYLDIISIARFDKIEIFSQHYGSEVINNIQLKW